MSYPFFFLPFYYWPKPALKISLENDNWTTGKEIKIKGVFIRWLFFPLSTENHL